ncbi:MAG TPA: PVC-type heme-binding CxxCH protein [Planctomycetota bacterium]|nr:PVC-type heme-binding CxxCH protein [Planctomycetota bacterium]
MRDSNYVLTKIAAEPDVVTPIGLEFDHKGRLLVIESHTHFPPKNYPGPKTDRILIVEDADKDGKADRFRTFYEGAIHTMSLTRGPDNWIYVATRMKVFRIRDTNNDDVADAEEEIARLETAGNYPHNGLCGLFFDAAGALYFGMGENLGEPYKLIGKDGTTLSGGGEGGNIYKCQADGSKLVKIATGIWNPFAICEDPHGRIFTVDNDPDSRPPCRLLQVVRTGDYGFQFRFGRQGVHPLHSWNGELPGMLPMLAGTGEAPCDVLPYHGALWVTCWGENRIDRYTLTPAGDALRTVQDTIVQGDQMFRPVDFALAPDGSLYFTDWVDKSYNVHRKGRIWRLARKDAPLKTAWPELTAAEAKGRAAEKKLDLELLKNPDAVIRQFAVSGLSQSPELATLKLEALAHPLQRLALLQAHKWNGKLPEAERDALISAGMADSDSDVCLFAVRWAADHELAAFRPKLDEVLKRSPMPASLFQVTLAAMDWLDLIKAGGGAKKLRQRGRDQYLADTLNAQTVPANIRALSLRMLPPEHAYLTLERLKSFVNQPDAALQREAVRALALRKKPDSAALLAELAAREDLPPALRADAVMGLASDAAANKKLIEDLAAKGPPIVKAEAERSLRAAGGKAPPAETKPDPENTDAWLKLLGDSGDADAGWRVFFSSQGGRCVSCHTHSGRGASVGPDLTGIGQRIPRERLLESILRPSKEVAPMFVPWVLKTKDGQVLTGFPIHATVQGEEEKFIGSDGQTFALKPDQIVSRAASKQSLMPDGLEQGMSVQDLRDLLAFLMRKE